MLRIFWVTFFFAFAAAGIAKDEERIVERFLKTSTVQHLLRPRPIENESGPTEIRLNFYVRHVENIDVAKGQWRVQLTFRQEWNDSRLAFSHSSADLKYITLTTANHIWTPDTFFSHELQRNINSDFRPETLIRIHPDGHILHSSRLTLVLNCPELGNGKDTVYCPLKISSYAYTAQEIEFAWNENHRVQLNTQNLFLERYTPYGLKPDGVVTTLDKSQTVTGTYPSALTTFAFTKGHDTDCKL